ncbi:MAG TPA: hypothetical protein VFA18_07830, partial [Gemmataceae bacterium]|nr:hypothetical protein [Gemmataceae bacterium]
MKRFLMSASVAALALALLAVPQSRANGRQGGSNHSSSGHSQKGTNSGDHHRAPVHFDHKFPHRSDHDFR